MNPEADAQTGDFPRGWYGDEHSVRWWDGQQWTEHVGVPIPRAWSWWRVDRRQWMRRVGWWLIAPLIGSPVILGIALMGDYFPMRTGVERDGQTLQVVHPVCPGERLLHVRLTKALDDDELVMIWELDGDVPLPRRFVLGDPIAGMDELIPLRAPLQPDDELTLTIATDLMEYDRSTLDFRPRDVPTTGILRADTVYPTDATFDRSALDDTPCDDPNHSEARGAVLLVVAAGIVVLAVPGFVLLFLTRTRRLTKQ